MSEAPESDKSLVEMIPREDLEMDEDKDIIGDGATAGIS